MTLRVADVEAASPQLDGRPVRVRGRLVFTGGKYRLLADDGDGALVLNTSEVRDVLARFSIDDGDLGDEALIDGVVHRLADGRVRLRLLARIALQREGVVRIASLDI